MPFGVEVKVRGTCVTRNGEFPVARMACTLDGGQAYLRFVSERLRRSLRSGARLRAEDMDRFCEEWLRMRGRPLDADAARRRARLLDLIARMSREADAL